MIKKNNLFFFIIVATHRSFISAYSVWRRRQQQQQLQLPDPFKRPNWTNAAWRILRFYYDCVFSSSFHFYSTLSSLSQIFAFVWPFVCSRAVCMHVHTYTRSCWRSYNLHFIVHASVVKLVIFCSKNSGNAIGNPHVRRC